jgi:hypothetical protein
MNEMISKTLRGLKDQGYRIGGVHLESDESSLSQELRETCHLSSIQPRPVGLNPVANARKASQLLLGGLRDIMAAAARETARAIVYMEGDKFSFVPQVGAMAAPILGGRADATLAVRSARGFSQFPRVQRLVEWGVNRYIGSQTGVRTDYLYGPRAFSPEVASLVREYRADDWGVMTYPVIAAIARGYRFEAVEVSGEPQPAYMQKYDAIMRSAPGHLIWRSIQNIGIVRAARAALRP